jgi:hypothetical protein
MIATLATSQKWLDPKIEGKKTLNPKPTTLASAAAPSKTKTQRKKKKRKTPTQCTRFSLSCSVHIILELQLVSLCGFFFNLLLSEAQKLSVAAGTHDI